MTFLQQTLGKNYKWWVTIETSIKSSMGSISANCLKIIGDIIMGLTIIYVWYINKSTFEVITYLLVGRIFKSLGEFTFFNRFSDVIISGKITNIIMRPHSTITFYGIEGIGLRLPRNLLESCGSLFSAGIFCYFAKFNFADLIHFDKFYIIFLLPIAYFVNYLTGFIVGNTGFFIKDKRDITMLNLTFASIFAVLQGIIIPLDKLPFANIFTFLPTSFVLHHPMQIYLGKYSTTEIIYTFFGGIAWCVVLWLLARIVFKLGLKKNEAVGL